MRCAVLILSVSIACGAGEGGGAPDAAALENPGFTIPGVTTTAYMPDGSGWQEVGPADWSCLDTPSTDVASTVAIEVSGDVVARNSADDRVPGAGIVAWAGNDVSAEPIASVTADADAAYALTLPVGTTRVAYRVSASGYVDTYLLNQYYPPDAPTQTVRQQPVSEGSADLLLALIGLERTAGTGIVAAAIRDCQRHEVAGAIATVSTVTETVDHAPGAETFYFSATSTSVPVQHDDQPVTNHDGRFMVIGLAPATRVFVQVWGFVPSQDPATDEPTLLAELVAPVLGDALVTASLEARRSE